MGNDGDVSGGGGGEGVVGCVECTARRGIGASARPGLRAVRSSGLVRATVWQPASARHHHRIPKPFRILDMGSDVRSLSFYHL
jgi:hypothetical protein